MNFDKTEAEIARMMNTGETNVDAHVTAQETQEVQKVREVKTVSDVFAKDSSMMIKVTPRVLLTLHSGSLGDSGNIPDDIEINNTVFSLHSPMRKGEGTEKSPYGIVRQELADLTALLGKMSAGNVTFFGAADIEDRVNELVSYIEKEVVNSLYSKFERVDHPVVPYIETIVSKVNSEDEGEDYDEDDLNDGLEDDLENTSETVKRTFDMRSLYSVKTWPSAEIVDNTLVVYITVNVQLMMPLLQTSADISKPLRAVVKIMKNYASVSGVDSDNMIVAYAFATQSLLDSSMSDFAATLAESEVSTISYTKVKDCVKNQKSDDHKLISMESSIEENMDTMFPSGTDVMVIL